MKIINLINKLNQEIRRKSISTIIHFNFFSLNVLKCLKKNNFIKDCNVITSENELKIKVYFIIDNITKCNIMNNLKLVSTKSNKIYLKKENIYNNIDTQGEIILSTNSGIKTGKEALLAKVGGEYLFKIIL